MRQTVNSKSNYIPFTKVGDIYRVRWDYNEIDDEYFGEQEKRFNEICHGEVVLKDGRVAKQLDMFDALQGAADGMEKGFEIKDNKIITDETY